MALFEVKGDLFDPKWGFDLIGHGVNLKGVMGAGIAAEVKRRWGNVYDVYADACDTGRLLPGLNLVVPVDNPGKLQFVANMATQIEPGSNASYDLVALALDDLFDRCEAWNSSGRIGLPEIGCGIGGLEWPIVREMIRFYADEYLLDVTVVHYAPGI